MTTRSTLKLTVEGLQAPPAPYLDQVRHRPISVNTTLLSGVADGEFDTLYAAEATILSAATSSLDLQTALDRYGNALTLTDVALVFIRNDADSVGNLVLNANASNGFTNLLGTAAALTLRPGDFILVSALTADNLVVSGTNKVLDLTASGGDVNYTLSLWGRK